MNKCKKNVGAHDCAQKGITLIALVITIIVMLILVAVTISMAVNGGLFDYAGKAVGETQNAIDAEQELGSGKVTIGETTYNSIDEYLNTEEKKFISTTKSYVGCYADIDGVEGIDGIIYADLAVGNTKGEKWSDDNGVYTIPIETGLKEYYVSQADCVGSFGTEPRHVIKATGGDGKDRFYVMALSDVTTADYSTFFWYKNAYGKLKSSDTAEEFGKGKENTAKIKGYWDAQDTTYGTQDPRDLWAQIDSDSKRTWFVPSRGEWAAFAQELGITSSNYSYYALGDRYWSSSAVGGSYAWAVEMDSRLPVGI